MLQQIALQQMAHKMATQLCSFVVVPNSGSRPASFLALIAGVCHNLA